MPVVIITMKNNNMDAVVNLQLDKRIILAALFLQYSYMQTYLPNCQIHRDKCKQDINLLRKSFST